MSTPIRLQILEALQAQLLTITQINGYNYNIGGVDLDFKSLDQIPRDSFPYICIQNGMSDYFPLTNLEYTSGRDQNSIDGWQVGIIGYLKQDGTKTEFSKITELFNQDIINCIQANPQLGVPAIVVNTYLVRIYEPISSFGEMGQITDMINHLIFKIKYDFTKTNA